MTLEVYPVADLMFTDQTTPPWLLVNPYLDQQERVRQRLESKLRRKVTIECREQPLAEVVADLAGKIDETVLIDIHALDDIGVGTDAPLTASLGEVTAKQALDWILDDLGLQYTLRDEALIITTPEEAESRLEIRVHSLRDVLYEYPVEPSWLPPELRGWPMSGGMMGSGGGGAMGQASAAGWEAWGAARLAVAWAAWVDGGIGGGGGAGGPAPGGASGAPVGLSSGGDAETPSAGPAEDRPAAEPDSTFSAAEPGAATEPERAAEGERYSYDSDTLVDLITSTIAPQSWDTVGGPGAIEFYPNSLGVVFVRRGTCMSKWRNCWIVCGGCRRWSGRNRAAGPPRFGRCVWNIRRWRISIHSST